MGEWGRQGFRSVCIGTEGCSSTWSYCDSLTMKDTDSRGVGMSTEHTVSPKVKGWLTAVDRGPVEQVTQNNGTNLGLRSCGIC